MFYRHLVISTLLAVSMPAFAAQPDENIISEEYIADASSEATMPSPEPVSVQAGSVAQQPEVAVAESKVEKKIDKKAEREAKRKERRERERKEREEHRAAKKQHREEEKNAHHEHHEEVKDQHEQMGDNPVPATPATSAEPAQVN